MVQETEIPVTSPRFRPRPFPQETAFEAVMREAGPRMTAFEEVMATPTAGERVKGAAAGAARAGAEPLIASLLAGPRVMGRLIAGAALGEENLQPEGEGVLAGAEAAVRGALPDVPPAVAAEPAGVASFLARDLPAGVAGTGALAATALAGGGMASALAGAFTSGANAYREAESLGATPAQKYAAFLLNLPIGAADALPIEFTLGRLGPSLARIDARAGGVIGKALLAEGATEGVQELISNVVAADLAAYDSEREHWKNVPEAALLGGVVGALFGGAVQISTRAKPGRPFTALDAVDAAAETLAAASTADHVGDADEMVGPSDRPRAADELLGTTEELPPGDEPDRAQYELTGPPARDVRAGPLDVDARAPLDVSGAVATPTGGPERALAEPGSTSTPPRTEGEPTIPPETAGKGREVAGSEGFPLGSEASQVGKSDLPNEPGSFPWEDIPDAPLEDRLAREDVRTHLRSMAQEAGQSDAGGMLFRDSQGGVAGRTRWVPRAEWWSSRPEGVSEAYLKKLVARATSDEPGRITPKQRDLLEWMLRQEMQPEGPVEREPGMTPERPPQGIKHRNIEAGMGDREPVRAEPTTFEAEHANAAAAIKADPLAGAKVVDSLEQRIRPLDATDKALAAHELTRLANERDDAEDDFNADPSEENQARIEKARAAFYRAGDLLHQAGSASGASLAFQKIMLARDYSLAAMERGVQVAKGGEPLTADESARVKELHDKLAATEKAHSEYVTAAELKRAELEAELAVSKLKREVKRAPRARQREERVAGIRAERDAIFERIVARAGSARSNFDPELLADVARFALAEVKLGLHSVSTKAEELIARFGEELRPHVEAAWKAAREVVHTDLAEKIKTRLDEGATLKELRPYVSDIAEHFVASGIEDRDAVVDAVHEVLKRADAKVTREQARDAISGYGDFRPLNQDEVKRKLRDVKGQLQAVAKLEALQKKQAPLRSGPERRTPSGAERALNKQVAELTKQLGIKTVDAAVQTKSALEALKARLKNSIADLTTQIETKTKIVDERAPVPRDAEARALEARRDALREQFDAIFNPPKPPKTQAELDALRVKVATKALEASIAEIERQIAGGAPRTQAEGPTTPELEAMRARRDALRAELDELRELAKPAVDLAAQEAKKAAAALKATKTRLANEEARTRERITFQDFEPATKRPPVELDPEAIAAKAKTEEIKLQFAREKRRHEMRNRTRTRKVLDAAAETLKIPKALWSSFDVSAVARQGAFFSAQDVFFRPHQFAPRIARMFRALASEKQQGRIETMVREDPAYSILKGGGVQFTGTDELSAREEIFQSALSEKIPGVAMSNRAFTTYMNLLRLDHGKRLLRATDGSAVSVRAVAQMVNAGTGRGNVGKGKFARAVESSGAVLWAPSLYVSRFQLLFGQPLYGGNARTRALFAREYATTLAAAGAFYSLVSLYNMGQDDDDEKATVSMDPTSPDFGKVKLGDTRLDPLAGLSQTTRLVARVGRSVWQSVRGGKPEEDAAQVAIQFLRTKVSPSISVPYALATGKEIAFGREKPRAETLKEMAIPLSFRDISETMEAQGIERGVALSLLALFGMGLQTYEERASKPTKASAERRNSRSVAGGERAAGQ